MWITNDNRELGVFVGDAGNVGIGSSSPSQKLDVSGVLRASGDFYAGSRQGGTFIDSIKVYMENTTWTTGTLDIDVDGGLVTGCVKTPD